MGFLDSLQKNNLFTDKNPNPLQPPNMGGFDPVNEFRNLFSLVASEKQKDRDLQLQLERLRHQPSGQINQVAHQALKPQPGETPNVVFDRRGDSADTFVNNILNPPERGFKFQELAQKNNLANQGLDIKRGDQDIRQQRANVYEFKSKNPNMHIVLPKGGNVLAINPQTGEAVDSGIPTGSLSDEDRINLQGTNNMNAIKERGSQNMNAIKERGSQNIKSIDERGSQNRQTQNEKPEKSMVPSQERTQQNNAARKLVNTRPDLAEFVTFDQQGNFSIDPNTPLNELSIIKGELYPKGDVKLPADKGSNNNGKQTFFSNNNNNIDRNKALEALKKHGLEATEENIKKAMDPKNWK